MSDWLRGVDLPRFCRKLTLPGGKLVFDSNEVRLIEFSNTGALNSSEAFWKKVKQVYPSWTIADLKELAIDRNREDIRQDACVFRDDALVFQDAPENRSLCQTLVIRTIEWSDWDNLLKSNKINLELTPADVSAMKSLPPKTGKDRSEYFIDCLCQKYPDLSLNWLVQSCISMEYNDIANHLQGWIRSYKGISTYIPIYVDIITYSGLQICENPPILSLFSFQRSVHHTFFDPGFDRDFNRLCLCRVAKWAVKVVEALKAVFLAFVGERGCKSCNLGAF